MRKGLSAVLAEVVGWLPFIVIWGLITLSLFSGFSVNQMVGNFFSDLPGGVGQFVQDTL